MGANKRKLIIKHRHESFIRQGGNCFYCGQPMWEHRIESREAARQRLGVTRSELNLLKSTAEHLVRKADGGSNCAKNIVAAHACCNSAREERTVAEHKAALWRSPSPVDDPQVVALIERLKTVKEGTQLQTQLFGKVKALRTRQLAEQIGYDLQVSL